MNKSHENDLRIKYLQDKIIVIFENNNDLFRLFPVESKETLTTSSERNGFPKSVEVY